MTFNTVWASASLTVLDEVLGSSDGRSPGQTFRTSRAPVLAGQRIEVLERLGPDPSTPAVTPGAPALARNLPTSVPSEAMDPMANGTTQQVWVPWHEVPDFHGSGPTDRHYVIDRSTGEIRFGNGRYGRIPPSGRGVVRAARYQAGGGRVGNRPAGEINRLKVTVPFVSSVKNLEPATGGFDAEPIGETLRRGPKFLRHRGRAVTVTDFGDLALEASREVARAYCVAPATGSGKVVLIIAAHRPGFDPVAGRGPVAMPPPLPIPTENLLAKVRAAIVAQMPPAVGLIVKKPAFLTVKVRAVVVPDRPAQASSVRTAVKTRLTAFLDPLAGGRDSRGWHFGQRPHLSDIHDQIKAVEGVRYVRNLNLDLDPPESSATTESIDPPLVVSGDHEIALFSDNESPLLGAES